jgi:NADH:ubiquinone oxidoreductase subunit 2 (subunit N)
MGRTARFLINFKLLKDKNGIMAFIFAMLIFSMSGIPPLGGFFVKFDILTSLMNNSKFYLNYILFFFTVASFFYYLRVIKIIYFDNEGITSTADIFTKSQQKFKIRNFNTERNIIIIVLFLILISYLVFIQKPLLLIQVEVLKTLF